MVLRLNESVYAPLYALFLVGPSANLLEIWWQARQSATASPLLGLRRYTAQSSDEISHGSS